MKHIGIDARLTAYRVGGISTYIRRVVQAFEALNTSNQYTVFQSRKTAQPLTRKLNTVKLWTPAHHRIERLALSVELARFQLDLLHSPDFIPPLRGAKHHIITVHDLTFLHYPEYLTRDSRRYYNQQIHTAVRQADHILSDSQSTKNDLIAMLNIPAEKITVHMLGVDERFRPLPDEQTKPIQQELELPASYFLFVGTLEPRKNILGLLHAYGELLNTLPDAPPIVLVGKRGWLFDETQSAIDKLPFKQQIIWREQVSDEQLPAIYNRALALITPSFYEGFGLPALEALACGTVPIVSNRSSLPEIVGDVGLLIDPDDTSSITEALHKALTDLEWRTSMQQKALVRAKSFTWEQTAKTILEVYDRVLQQGDA